VPSWAPGLTPADRQRREAEVEEEARANLARRQFLRRRSATERQTLEELRAGRDVCWPEEAANSPLVSVVIPTYSRGRILVERSLASVVRQTYRNLEVVVVGDHATDETLEAIRTVDDPRVRFEDLPVHSPYPEDPELAWMCVGSRPFNRGLELARGWWIAPQADDDEFTPDHVETLLAAPLRHMNLDEECWRENEPNDWNLWRRMLDAGVRAGHVEHIVFRHYMEAHHRRRAAAGVT
jgi:hypothetical protein